MGRHSYYNNERRQDEALRSIPGLPPLPDPETGRPFPPAGNGFHAWRRRNRQPDIWPYQKPKKPEGTEGPLLAWMNGSLRVAFALYALVVVVLMLAIGVVVTLRDGDPIYSPMKYWQLWALALIAAPFISNPLSFDIQGAGAYWYAAGKRRQWYQRRTFMLSVCTYDLILIEVEQRPGREMLRLDDMHGNGILQPIAYFQENQSIWDLVYNGILYSVASGAEIGEAEVETLELDQSPYWDAVVRHRSSYSEGAGSSE